MEGLEWEGLGWEVVCSKTNSNSSSYNNKEVVDFSREGMVEASMGRGITVFLPIRKPANRTNFSLRRVLVEGTGNNSGIKGLIVKGIVRSKWPLCSSRIRWVEVGEGEAEVGDEVVGDISDYDTYTYTMIFESTRSNNRSESVRKFRREEFRTEGKTGILQK